MFKIGNLFFVFVIFVCCQFSLAESLVYDAELVKPPVATKQLGPAIFLPAHIIKQLNVVEGNPIAVRYNSNQIHLRVYDIFSTDTVFAMHSKWMETLGIKPGKHKIVLDTQISNTDLKPKPIRFSVENYKGDLDKWHGFVLAAPHGDCDRETGEIVKIVSEKYGIPATAVYGCRLSYRGIWYDCNRPLMKMPKKGGGVIPERMWNEDAYSKFKTFYDSIRVNNNLKINERIKFYCSFHGHDLTVKLNNSIRIERPVIEGMGVGFSKVELRRIKEFYNQRKNQYYKNPPELYFGNLPEDRIYYYDDITLQFFYSGLGTRTYGTMRSDIIEYGLHLETPNSMRIEPQDQKSTAAFLNELYTFIKDSILSKKEDSTKLFGEKLIIPSPGKKISISKGSFLMGAPEGVGWSGERPQHSVKVNSFSMDVYEVTNLQYVEFLNQAYEQELIFVNDGIVYKKSNPEQIICKTQHSTPLSNIDFLNQRFNVITGYELYPVIFVSWFGAEMYARFSGERLPTEAEWEYAASWDLKAQRKYVYAVSADSIFEQTANFEDSGDIFEKGPSIVGFFKENSPFGIADMGGNVWEWCSDWYKYYYYKDEPESGWDNPTGPENGTMRVIKGGAWNTEAAVTRTTMRLGIHPNETLVNLGFRCVKAEERGANSEKM